MPAGVRGRLISASFLDTELAALDGVGDVPAPSRRALASWSDRLEAIAGPASSVRSLADGVVVPLLKILGYHAIGFVGLADSAALLEACGRNGLRVPVVVVPWGEPLDGAWRAAV